MPFTVRSGNIYFVSTSGSNSNSGSYNFPWRTWQHAANYIISGDIVYGRGGSYTTAADLGTFNRCLSIGTYAGNSGGAAGNPKAFVAYPAEAPILYPAGVSNAIIQIYFTASHIVISQLHLYNPIGSSTDASSIGTSWSSGGETDWHTNIRIVGNVCQKNFLSSYNAMSGAITAANGSDIQIIGNKLYNIGSHKQEHGIYLNESVTNATVEYNEVYDIHNGYGIEVYNDYGHPYKNCIIRNNLVYRCGRSGIQLSSVGTFKVYNNIIWDCGQISFAGLNIRWGSASSTYEIYNNTLYDNGQNELTDGNDVPGDEPFGQVWLEASVQTLAFRNNIIVSLNSSEPYWRRSFTRGTQTFSNNLYYGNGGKPAFDNAKATLNVNPKFVNPPEDFNLQKNSPCINGGLGAIKGEKL